MTKTLKINLLVLCMFFYSATFGQSSYELNNGWVCAPSKDVKEQGEAISKRSYQVSSWKPAVVPGTVLTTLLANKEVPDPFFGMNNNQIPDIYETGKAHYTYWFVKDFRETATSGDQQVWLNFRGINYSCDIFLNGKKVNREPYEGMFLRKSYNITEFLSSNGDNRLAVIVHPADPVGKPNGGQGGDGRIAKSVAHQYTAGWDWIQPIRDRNTGIWDKVTVEKTGSVNLKNPHIVTLVPGKRKTEGPQQPAVIKISAELQNTQSKPVQGVLLYKIDGTTISSNVTLAANSTQTVSLPDFTLKNPRLWWPAGYGKQDMYPLTIEFYHKGKLSDKEQLNVGIREFKTDWNQVTQSMQVLVNGQKIFIKGGNWIISDAMLRFSKARYDAEIRFHRDMNLNLLRIWGGALTERPEFYEACDKYGLLVIQDFWMSGDCNGRWVDPFKADDQWTRRKYPDDHQLFLTSAADMIKMIRNHASLAIWCGGNEITPPEDILVPLRDSLLPKLDGTRWFIDYSNSDSMSYNFIGGNGDGPYTIQPIRSFWQDRTYPFNSEVGSVGVGDYESLKRFLPEKSLRPPVYQPGKQPNEDVDEVWTYHNYTGVGYEGFIEPYGKPKDIKDFAMKAQLVNYDQYRALIEGFSSHMWSWYTGVIIWKTQNPWTSMRGQMYDYYLDPNACLYGLRNGSEQLHVMCNPINGMVMVVNNGFEDKRSMMLEVKSFDIEGNEKLITQVFSNVNASDAKKILSVRKDIEALSSKGGGFIQLRLLDENKQILSENLYWFADEKGNYSGLNSIKKSDLNVTSRYLKSGQIEVTLTNPSGGPVAFFNRISLVDKKSSKRILPVFYSDNYISVVPGAQKKITLDYTPQRGEEIAVTLEGWNSKERIIQVSK